MNDVQTISSDEEDDCRLDRPYGTPGWFRPSALHDVTKSSITGENCDDAQVQNTKNTVFHDTTRGTVENRKRGRLSDQDPSFASRKRPYIDSSTDSEPQSFPGAQQGRSVKDTFSVVSQPEGPTHPDRRRDPYPEPARHSPFHFFLKPDNICKSPDRGSDSTLVFDAASPVFNTCRRPSQVQDPVEVLSSDDSDDSYIWTSSQMVAPLRNFQKKPEIPDVISSDDEIAPSQLDPRFAKKDFKRITNSFNGRTPTDRDGNYQVQDSNYRGQDGNYRDRDTDYHGQGDNYLDRDTNYRGQDGNYLDCATSAVGNSSSDSESESPILRKAPEIIPCSKPNGTDVRSSVSSGFHQIRDPMACHSTVITTPETVTRSSFKIPVIVAECNDQSHASCRSYKVNIAPLSLPASQAAVTRTVPVLSPRSSSEVLPECKVVLSDSLEYRISDSCGDTDCSCHVRSLPDRGQPASEAGSGGGQQPAIEQRPEDRPRRWSMSWDRSDSESQSVLGNPVVANGGITDATPANRQSGVNVSIQRLSAQVNPDMFSDDDLFDDYAMTQCDEAVAKALRSNESVEFKKPFDVAVHDKVTKIEVGCQCEFGVDAAVGVGPASDLYSQQDDCIILSDSDDELFANLTQANMNPMAVRDSDDETVDDGWNDDDDDIDATLLSMDESCFVVPSDDNVVRVEPTAEDWNEEETDSGGKSKRGGSLTGLVHDAKLYGEVGFEEVEGVPQYQQNSVVKEEAVYQSEAHGSALKDLKLCAEVEVEADEVAYVQEGRQASFIKEENVRESGRCSSPLKSSAQEVTPAIKILCSLPYPHSPNQDSSLKALPFASIRAPMTAEDSGCVRRVVGTIGERNSEEDDIPIGELIDKQKVQQGLKRYRETWPVWTQALPRESPEKTSEFDVDSDEEETVLPRFDSNRGCLLLRKDAKIHSPPEILEVEIDEEPAPIRAETTRHDPCEGRVIKSEELESEKLTDFPGEIESDAEEEEENYHSHLKDDESTVTKVNYLKCDELEKSEHVRKYYSLAERDQWLSKTSPQKPLVISPQKIGGLGRKRRPGVRTGKATSNAVPDKRKKRSMSEDQGLKIAQLRDSHALPKKKAQRVSSDNRSYEKDSKIEQSIRNARNVMRERAKQLEKENKERVSEGKTSLREEKPPGKISIRRKTVPATSSSTDKSGVGSYPRPTMWDKKRGPTEEASTSVLDTILGPADKDSVPSGVWKSGANRPGTVATTSENSKKHSKIPDAGISERTTGEVLGVFKRPTSMSVRSREKGTGFKIPRLSSCKVGDRAAVPVAESIGSTERPSLGPEPDSRDALGVKRTEVATSRGRETSKEKTTSNQSHMSKRKLDSIVSERERGKSDVRKTPSISPKSFKSPRQSPGIVSVSSKFPSTKSATPVASESSTSSSSKSVLAPSSAVAPLMSLSAAPKPFVSNTSKSSTHVASKSSSSYTSKSSSATSKSQSLSRLQNSLDVSCDFPSKSKKDEMQQMKSNSTSIVNSGSIRTNRKTSTLRSNMKSSEISSDRRNRSKESEKHGSRSDRVSHDVAPVRKFRSDSSRVADQRASVPTELEKSTMLEKERERTGDDSVGRVENCALPDKPGSPAVDGGGENSEMRLLGQRLSNGDRRVVQRLDRNATPIEQCGGAVADATASDAASKVQLGQPLSGIDKHAMQPPNRTRTTVENQSKTRDRVIFDQRHINRKRPVMSQPEMVAPPVNDMVENHLETVKKPVESPGGNNTTDTKQTAQPDPEGPLHSVFAMPTAVVRPMAERDPRRGAREVVRTTAPALGREMESITLSQIVNDSIRKTGPMPSPLLSEVVPKRRVQLDVVQSNRQLERESRKLTDLPRARVDVTAVLAKDGFTSTILYWNPAWMKECETVKLPPPIVNYDKVYPLLDTYDSFTDYANILQPLMLMEMWESMIKDWKEAQRCNRQRSSKVIATYLRIEKEQRHMFLHCQGVVTQQENAMGRCLRESDLVVLNLRAMPVSPKGQQPDPSGLVIKPVFGIVSKVNRHIPGKTQEPLNPKIEELKKSTGDRCFIITYIIEFAYRKQRIDNSEFITVEPVTSILSSLRQFSGLANLPRSTLAAEILRPSQWEVFHHNVEIGANQLKDSLNSSQKDAISKIAKAVLDPYFPPKICLLQGPPGTGKSLTVIGLIEHLLAQNGNFHILLCAPSNAGIDELCRRLIDSKRLERSAGNRKGISFVRLGAMSSIHMDIAPYSLQILAKQKYEQQQKNAPTSVQSTLMSLEQKQKEWKAKLDKCLKENDTSEAEIARKELKTLEKRRESISGGLSKPMSAAEEVRMKKEVLMGVDVVCTTLNHSGSQHIVDMMYHQDATRHHFGCVIVDEACQCTEVDCLIPLQYRSSKLVLVGDPEQLPPTVLSKKAGDMSYGQSLFERLYNQLKPAPSSNQSNPVLMLETQYRMHEDICQFSNKYFYSGRLQTNPVIAKKRSQFPSSAYAVFDLQYAYERSDQRSVSLSNPDEADFIVQLCQHLASLMTPEKAVENVGIITPYQSQRLYILQLLKQRCWELSAIEVGTVDGFQGREKDVIILSCVRANSTRNIGFLSDRRRMNVSLTRAKYALYIVGHMKTLTSNPDWSALVADAQHRDRMVKVLTAQQALSQIQLGCRKP